MMKNICFQSDFFFINQNPLTHTDVLSPSFENTMENSYNLRNYIYNFTAFMFAAKNNVYYIFLHLVLQPQEK